MANIKFSQFTVGNTESDIDFVVGYKGANNIQISPANLLSATLAGYLPLTGGTMTGNIVFNDNVKGTFGSSQDLEIFHNGTDSSIRNFEGDLIIRNADADKDILFQSDNGSGGLTTYFFLDGSRADGTYIYTEFPDNSIIGLGNDTDLQMYHNSTNSVIDNYTGDLAFQQKADDKDIVFKCDDGSGGVATYFRLDGSAASASYLYTNFPDNSILSFGNASDLLIYHDTTNSQIFNKVGDLVIRNDQNDGDIKFLCDDGSGGVTEYFRLDGGSSRVLFSKNQWLTDNVKILLGNNDDLQIYHNATDSAIENNTGDLYISNFQDDGNIIFRSDNGSGGHTQYFRLDGGDENITFSKNVKLIDNVQFQVGTDLDLRLYHDSTNSYISNFNNNLNIINYADDADISFQCDNGSGSITEYFRLDGSAVITRVAKSFLFEDNIKSIFGAGSDLQIYHSGTDSFINNDTGDLIIKNFANDKDIIFQSDNGSGGIATYFYLDGSLTTVSPRTVFPDNSVLGFGTGADLQIYHDGTTSNIANYTNNLSIINHFDDGDIKFFSDDGSGGVTEYFRLDGGDENVRFSKNVKFSDSVHAVFGNSADLKIYHDGSNSFVQDTGTGALFLEGNGEVRIRKSATSEIMSKFIADGAVELYYDNVKKLETTNTGIRIAGVSEYADNTAAIAGGLTTGDVYRTGDLLKIVH